MKAGYTDTSMIQGGAIKPDSKDKHNRPPCYRGYVTEGMDSEQAIRSTASRIATCH
jgi:hypothetical protein